MRRHVLILLVIIITCGLVGAAVHLYTEYAFSECDYDIDEVQKVAWNALGDELKEHIVPATENYRLVVYDELTLLPSANMFTSYVNRKKVIVLVEFSTLNPGVEGPYVAYVDPFEMEVIGWGWEPVF